MGRTLQLTAVGATVAMISASCGAFSSDEASAAGDDAGSDGASSADGGEAGASAGSCKSSPTTGWGAPVRLAELRGDGGEIYFIDPFVSADGLTLVLAHQDGDKWRVYRTSRATRDATWGPVEAIGGFGNPSYAEPYPSLASPTEIVVTAPQNAASLDLGSLVAPSAPGDWSYDHFGELQRADIDTFATVTSDGVAMVYSELGASAANPFRTLWQTTRSAPQSTSSWSGPRDLDDKGADGGSLLPEGIHHPAITPDGLGLFYAVDARKDVVYFVSRKTRDDNFFTATSTIAEIPGLVQPDVVTRVRSMTADGCEIYLTSNREGVLDTYVARRGP